VQIDAIRVEVEQNTEIRARSIILTGSIIDADVVDNRWWSINEDLCYSADYI